MNRCRRKESLATVHHRGSTCATFQGPERGTRRFLDKELALSNLINCWFADRTTKRTMTTISIEQAGKYDGQEVTIPGWMCNLRESGELLFPIFSDGTGVIKRGV